MRTLPSIGTDGGERRVRACLVVALLAGALAPCLAADDRVWLTGTVFDVMQGTTGTGTTSTSNASPNGTTTTTSTVTSVPYTEYSIRVANKLFVVRPDPVIARQSRLSRIGSHLGWGWLKPLVPVTIPASVGDSISIFPEGNRAWVKITSGTEYSCSLVRQSLLSDPQPTSAKDSPNPGNVPGSDTQSYESRPTLKRDK